MPSVSDIQSADKNDEIDKASKHSNKGRAIEKDDFPDENSKLDTNIDKEDLITLKHLAKNEINLSSYKISIKGDIITLEIKMKPGANIDDGKEMAINILGNLNLIKGGEDRGENELGGLYKNFKTKIKIREHSNSVVARGKSSKGAKAIKWN